MAFLTFIAPFLAKLKAFYQRNKKTIFMAILAIIFCIVNFVQFGNNKSLQQQIAVADHNTAVLQDSVRILKDREGNVEFTKLAFLTNSYANLEKLNKDLANELDKIQGQVSTIIKGNTVVIEKQVPFVVRPELVDSTVYAHFNYDTTYGPGDYKKLSGYTAVDLKTGKATGEKTNDEIGISITTGIMNLDKGKPEIFLKSNHPGFNVTKLDGAVLDPKLFQPKKKVPLITPSLTVGWTPLTYDFNSHQAELRLKQVGITAGVGFNLFKIFGVTK